MPEDDERSQSGCEMRDSGANPGLYLISGLGVQLSHHFKVLATCDAYEADGIARRRGVLIGFKNSNGRDVELFLSNEFSLAIAPNSPGLFPRRGFRSFRPTSNWGFFVAI